MHHRVHRDHHWTSLVPLQATEKSNSILHTFMISKVTSQPFLHTRAPYEIWSICRVQLHRSMTYQGSLWTSVRPSHLKDSLIRSFLDKEMVVHSMLKLWAHFWQMTKAPLLESDYHNFPWGRSPFELLEKWKAMFVNMTLLQSIISLGLTLLHF